MSGRKVNVIFTVTKGSTFFTSYFFDKQIIIFKSIEVMIEPPFWIERKNTLEFVTAQSVPFPSILFKRA